MRPLVPILLVAALTASGVRAEVNRPHLLLISVDTLRADYLSSYGYPHRTSPQIDALASEGVLFEDTLTTIGKTGPAFASLFTSLYPPTHGARRNGVPVRPDVTLLAERLKGVGYDTAAFISNWTLRQRLCGLGRGFDHYDESFNRSRYGPRGAERDAPSLTRAVRTWLQENRPEGGTASSPLFLWVHFSEPHSPYDQHAGFTVPEPPEKERSDGWYRRWKYASEVRYVDHWVGQVLAAAKRHLGEAPALTIFISDHGESLGEHDYWGHGKNAHWPNLRIPLIIRGPGFPAGKRVLGPASILDLLPTLLEVLKLAPAENAEGVSLVGTWSDSTIAPQRPRFAFADRHIVMGKKGRLEYEDPLAIAQQTQAVKTLFDFERRRVVYYDLAHDPLELQALTEPPLDTVPPLRRRLANWYRQLKKYEAGTRSELTPEDVRQLKTLGYIGR